MLSNPLNPRTPSASAGKRYSDPAYAWEQPPPPQPHELERLRRLNVREFRDALVSMIEERYIRYRDSKTFDDINAAFPGGYFEFEARQTRSILCAIWALAPTMIMDELNTEGFK